MGINAVEKSTPIGYRVCCFWKKIRSLQGTYLMTFRNVFEFKKKIVYFFFHSQMVVLLFSRKSVIYWNSCVIIEFSLSSSYISNWLQTVFDIPTSWICQGQTFTSLLMDGFTVWTALLPSPGYCPHVYMNLNHQLCVAQVLF